MPARRAALLALSAVEEEGAWANAALKRELAQAKLDKRDAALATKLCLGCLQNQSLLDFYLQAFASMKITKMEKKVRVNLRIGLYQILFLERIPHSAAVNEAVELTRKYGKNPRAAGMVNGILRAILRSLDALPSIEQADEMDTLALQYSHPRWLVDEFARLLPREELLELLQKHNTAADTTIQVNSVLTNAQELATKLAAEEVESHAHAWISDCLVLESMGSFDKLSAFVEGLLYAQDAAARLAVLAADPQRGMRVLDACAAPGGKSFATAIAMQNEGEIIACDIYPHKRELIEAGAQRLGLSCIKTQLANAEERNPAWVEQFDLVLADVPCSGLGVIRKKPEIRYKDPKKMVGLPPIQRSIVSNVSAYVKPGGVLLYATCTIRPEENEAVIAAFLRENPHFALESFTLPKPIGTVSEGMLTLWPQRFDTDGFFIAKLRRQA